jgi:hypothetical protein
MNKAVEIVLVDQNDSILLAGDQNPVVTGQEIHPHQKICAIGFESYCSGDLVSSNLNSAKRDQLWLRAPIGQSVGGRSK